MDKLELKHLAPYLPYDLLGIFRQKKETLKSCTHVFINREILYGDFKPILKPLSDLKKVKEGGTTYVGYLMLLYNTLEYSELRECISIYVDDGREYDVLEMPYCLVQQLLEWHFDVFGLIEKGLAININTLNN